MKQDVKKNLSILREVMAKQGISAVIIPQTDSHQSEYLAEYWQVRRFFSNFTGSAGDLIVTADKALLWTDSRYFLQATSQLAGSGIELMKDGLAGTPDQATWLKTHLQSGDIVGVDSLVLNIGSFDSLARELAAKGIRLIHFDPAIVWASRPGLPKDKIFIHDEKFAGRSAKEKIADALRVADQEYESDSVLISALDEIAWILNIRSRDVLYNPVATGFLYLSPKLSTLFTDPDKLTAEVLDYLASQGVQTAPYSSLTDFIHALPENEKVLIQTARTAKFIQNTLGTRAILGDSVVALPKAQKNDTQVAGIRAAMERDGVALVKAVIEIERRIAVVQPLHEVDVDDILFAMRAQQPHYFDRSFGTAAGYGPNGAIVHYEAEPETCAVVKTGNLLLIDSGAQYLDGTTDITRTISIGEPTAEQKRDFTLVMKGHIALSLMQFPEGTTGHQLDAIARMFLWKNGLSYLHGTGHGVGQFLNVHEGPQSIRLNYVPTPLLPGMITSNEPGLYRENVHGIRCENLVLTVPSVSNEFGKFLKFETLTLFPFDLSLFDTSIMSDEEIEWVNNYHTTVRSRLTPLLNSAERTWLEKKTAILTRK